METLNEDAVAAKNIVHFLRIVNDISERGVVLMEESSEFITTNEKQK